MLQDATDSKAVVINENREIISGWNNLPKKLKFDEGDGWYINEKLYDSIEKCDEIESNIKDFGDLGKDYFANALAMHGLLLVCFKENEFSDEEINLMETCAIGLSVINRAIKYGNFEEEKKKLEVSERMLGDQGLSYTEFQVVDKVFDSIKGDEGFVVASKIADDSGFARSVTVNALKKLESAGIVSTRSLGVKGTRIKVLNEQFPIELKRRISESKNKKKM